MPTCDDLRLGGTLSATGIANGTSINSTALSIADWSGVFGNPGISYSQFQSLGRPGSFFVGDGLPKARNLTLNMQITRWGPTLFALTEPTEAEQLVANTDIFLALLQAPQYLEVDLPDGSKRFVQVYPIDPAPIRQPRRSRTISVPLVGSPYWRAGGNQSSDTLSGADTLTTAGTVNVYDAVLVFSGDGTLTNSTAGWAITITGSTGAVTVDLGNRTVTQAGLPAEQLITVRTDLPWGWFVPGVNTVNATVSVAATWRDAYA